MKPISRLRKSFMNLVDKLSYTTMRDHDESIRYLFNRMNALEQENRDLMRKVDENNIIIKGKLENGAPKYYHVVLTTKGPTPSIRRLPVVQLSPSGASVGKNLCARNCHNIEHTELGRVVRIDERQDHDNPNIAGTVHAEADSFSNAVDDYCKVYFSWNPLHEASDESTQPGIQNSYETRANIYFTELINRNGFNPERMLLLKDQLMQYVRGQDNKEDIRSNLFELKKIVDIETMDAIYGSVAVAEGHRGNGQAKILSIDDINRHRSHYHKAAMLVPDHVKGPLSLERAVAGL